MNPLILRKTPILPLLIVGVLACLRLVSGTQAVMPPPDGGYPWFTTAEGTNALRNLTTGVGNTAVGWFSLFINTDASYNTAVGAGTLLFNTADENTAIGVGALLSNTTGHDNTANGVLALSSNTIGNGNTANGDRALFRNASGDNNTATGIGALESNTEGGSNTAVGGLALFFNSTGSRNTATGFQALSVNNSHDNTATGFQALLSNTSGTSNTGTGLQALQNNTTGDSNTACGAGALLNNSEGNQNTAVGLVALQNNTTGSNNTALGYLAGSQVTTASNVICIGTSGINQNNTCFIGNVYSNVQPIGGTDPDYVTVNSTGRLGRGNVSSRRYKHEIKSMNGASEALFALRPVSFRYHKEYDARQRLTFGLIAEEVAEVAPDLVGRNSAGQPESVRYDAVNAMLLNEFLKEHRKVQELEANDAEQQGKIKALIAIVKEQSAQIQKISADIEMSKATPIIVLNNP